MSRLQVGITELSITPEPGRRMAGMPGSPRAEGVAEWPLFARVMLLDNGRRAAIVSLDLVALSPANATALRNALARSASNLAASSILLACSHTHRAPFAGPGIDEDTDFDYVEMLRSRLTEAVASAEAALQPATLYAGTSTLDGCSFTRRPVYRGEQVGTQRPWWIEDFVRPEGPVDNQVQVLLARDTQGNALGGMVDFACHPTIMGSQRVYNTDFPGAFTAEVRRRHGGVFGFLQGASGNTWPFDMSRPGLAETQRDEAHVRRVGAALADAVDVAIGSASQVPESEVFVESASLDLKRRVVTREQLDLARWYLEQRHGEPVDEREFTRKIYGHDYTFYANSSQIQERL